MKEVKPLDLHKANTLLVKNVKLSLGEGNKKHIKVLKVVNIHSYSIICFSIESSRTVRSSGNLSTPTRRCRTDSDWILGVLSHYLATTCFFFIVKNAVDSLYLTVLYAPMTFDERHCIKT